MRHHDIFHKVVGTLSIAALAVALGGCVEIGLPAHGDQTHAPLIPIFGMHNDPALEDQQAQPFWTGQAGWQTKRMRYPAPETLPRHHRGKVRAPASEQAEPLENPVPVTEDSLRYGKTAYLKTCGTCHGPAGKGNAAVGRYISAMPSLTSDRVSNYSDGRIYRVITHGWARMWSYKSQLKPMERWAVVNYVRVLQRAESPEPWDYDYASAQDQ